MNEINKTEFDINAQNYCIADANVFIPKYMMLSCSKKSKCCEKHKKGKRCKKCPNC